jgi:hypothetical protein
MGDIGRPTKYRPEYCDQVIAHMKEGASLTSFAAELCVARSTINEWMANNPEFSESVKIGKAACAAWWERLGRNNAMSGDGNATLVIFGLKNMAPEDWRDRREFEHSNPDGSLAPTKIIIQAASDANGNNSPA